MTRTLLALAGFLLVFITQLFTLQHCATPTSPSGGARDSIGPVLIEEETTPNFQTNFRPEEIVITFDEWVEQDAKQEIIISPPLALGPDNQPYLRRRSLVIPLQGLELRDSVTYVVNIGSAIKDLNEGNPTENLRFVFATGPVLDSATVSGTLVEDFTGEPVDGATFTLYSNLSDTATTTENPTYFAQTDEEGSFTIYNIRPGRYRAVGLVRNPGATNYYVDLNGTFKPLSIGFIDSLLTVNDGNTEIGTVRISPVGVPAKVIGVDTAAAGRIAITMNQRAEKIDLRTNRTDYLRYNVRDTINLFFRDPGADTIFVGRDAIFRDTIVVNAAGSLPAGAPEVVAGPGATTNPATGLVFFFDQPLERVDTSLISLRRDTLPGRLPFRYDLDSLYPGEITLRTGWAQNTQYFLDILPGALTGWNNQSNRDTISRKFRVENPESFGTLSLSVQDLDTTLSYVLSLVKKEEVVSGTRRFIRRRGEYFVTYRGLRPGDYQVELIYDGNDNQRYDAGNFLNRRQPELIRRFKIEALRANWEVEEVIELK